MMKKPVAYQIYSAREQAEKDLDSVLATLKSLGYDGVEFAGFYGNTAEQISALLKKHSLIAISSHVPFSTIETDMAGTIAFHKAIGCKFIAIPYLDDNTRPGAKGFAKTIAAIYQFGQMTKEAGITLLYHNHDFEFITMSEQYGLDFLYDAVPADLLKTEIDVCWVKYAGLVPADYIREYAGRCPVVHLKDYVGVKGGATPYGLIGLDEEEKKGDIAFEFRPVGHGSQDVKSILEAGIESGAEWFVVEQDMPAPGSTPLEDAKKSIETLKGLGLK